MGSEKVEEGKKERRRARTTTTPPDRQYTLRLRMVQCCVGCLLPARAAAFVMH